jgi:hypothetical protein
MCRRRVGSSQSSRRTHHPCLPTQRPQHCSTLVPHASRTASNAVVCCCCRCCRKPAYQRARAARTARAHTTSTVDARCAWQQTTFKRLRYDEHGGPCHWPSHSNGTLPPPFEGGSYRSPSPPSSAPSPVRGAPEAMCPAATAAPAAAAAAAAAAAPLVVAPTALAPAGCGAN